MITSNNLLKDKEYSSIAPVDVFAETKTFIVVLTKEYLTSTKTKQELATINSGVKEDNDRLFKILISDIPLADQTDTIKDLVPYLFFEKDKDTNLPVEFSKIRKYQSLKRFWLRLTDLSYNLSFAIKEKQNTISEKEVVFLAETGFDQYTSREVIRRELIHYGYTVLPKKIISSNEEKAKEYIKSCIEKSDLSVHLISSSEGRLIGNTGIVYLQNNIAAQYCTKSNNYKRLLWIPYDLVFENEDQRVSVEKLKRDSDALEGAELVQTPIEEFKSLLHRSLVKLSNRDLEMENAINSQSIYIINNIKYETKAREIGKLLSANGVNVIHQIDTNDKKELLINHKRNLIICSGVVVFNDIENESWVDSKMKDIVKSVGFGRKEPIKAKALIVSDKKEITEKNFSDFEIIDDSKGVNNESVKMLIEKLKR